MTSPRLAAEGGKLDAVKRILRKRAARKNSKDSFDSTPLIRAALNRHWDGVGALRPYVLEALTNRIAKQACERFRAAVVNIFEDKDSHGGVKNKVNKYTIWQVLYARDDKDPVKFAIPHVLDNNGSKSHCSVDPSPANNISWLEALLTKRYLEEDCRDVTIFKRCGPGRLSILQEKEEAAQDLHGRPAVADYHWQSSYFLLPRAVAPTTPGRPQLV
ncbi:hypothetical protein AYL99_06472 [Fonsecaea erecta]|uniref:Uncharacterized protein n=1 Tax=Fonsecaea erecta TaxID=1367422 RepID=A0A178ZH92_9EURO|nr:hypothetical protein AYL99_06472 [Fonsecaea erecta]OAP59174.1 hypothetical protein AYL99_06472 [Fonsecaea erecta]